jgi:peptidoglycan L-alanyl-D-glutamate endopeptidase CwlK
MMPRFGRRSKRHLETLTPGLRLVLEEAIKIYDFSVIQGHRSHEEQARLYAKGRTTPGPRVTNARPGQSNHNISPSPAVDVAPYIAGTVAWDRTKEFYYLAGLIMGIAKEFGVSLRWGGRWKSIVDLPHFEEVNP